MSSKTKGGFDSIRCYLDTEDAKQYDKHSSELLYGRESLVMFLDSVYTLCSCLN